MEHDHEHTVADGAQVETAVGQAAGGAVDGQDVGDATAVVRAALAHVDFIVTQEDLAIDDAAAGGADGAGEFVEDVVSVLSLGFCLNC